MALGIEDYRAFLKRKTMEAQMASASAKRGTLRAAPVGSTRMLAGHQLAAVYPFLERIRAADPERADRLLGYLKTLPKYSALEFLIDERSEIAQKFPREALAILEAVLTEEMRADGTEKRIAEAQT